MGVILRGETSGGGFQVDDARICSQRGEEVGRSFLCLRILVLELLSALMPRTLAVWIPATLCG